MFTIFLRAGTGLRMRPGLCGGRQSVPCGGAFGRMPQRRLWTTVTVGARQPS